VNESAAPPAILASSAVAPAPLPTGTVPAASAAGHLELSFPGGVVLRLEGKVDAATLRAVIAAAKG
jgi:aconitase B